MTILMFKFVTYIVNITLVISRCYRLPQWLSSKESPAMHEVQEMQIVGGRENPMEKGVATHSSTLAWKIPWMEVPGRL